MWTQCTTTIAYNAHNYADIKIQFDYLKDRRSNHKFDFCMEIIWVAIQKKCIRELPEYHIIYNVACIATERPFCDEKMVYTSILQSLHIIFICATRLISCKDDWWEREIVPTQTRRGRINKNIFIDLKYMFPSRAKSPLAIFEEHILHLEMRTVSSIVHYHRKWVGNSLSLRHIFRLKPQSLRAACAIAKHVPVQCSIRMCHKRE